MSCPGAVDLLIGIIGNMTLYLHIGAQKTGTTTIQAALDHGRARLQEVGLHYPEVEPGDRNKVSHYNSLRGFFSHDTQHISSTRSFLERINGLDGDVLLSGEALSNWPAVKPGQTPDDYWARKQDLLSRMRESIADPDVRIIFCIRERRSYLKSLFKQHLKVQKRPSSSIEDELRGFLRREVVRSDMQRQVHVWQQVFGEVRVIRFDDHARDGSLLKAFMQQIDRDLPLQDVEPRNVSPDWTDLELRRIGVTFGVKKPAIPVVPEARTQFNEATEAMVRRMIDGALAREGASGG